MLTSEPNLTMALEKAKYSTNAGSPDNIFKEAGTPGNTN